MEAIYLDYNSTTPVDEIVLEKMLPYFSQKFGNASSSTHAYGWVAAAAVEKAREQTASLIGAEPSEIIFTSGATESLNLAIRGAMDVYAVKGRHMIVCATEHKAVLDTASDLAGRGTEVSILEVDREGRIDLTVLEKLIRADTVLICVMMANNETGVIQDCEAIGVLARSKKVLFLCDTTQAAGKIRVNTADQHIDMCTLSAHKLYGPKGVGALYVKRKEPRVKLSACITGGGHERGLRSGTLNVPGIVGLGMACELAGDRIWEFASHTSRLRTFLEQQLCIEFGLGSINGSTRYRLPNTTNIVLNGIRNQELIRLTPDIAISRGSACSSSQMESSHVLKAMGLNANEIERSLRFSVGMHTSEEDIRTVIQRICAVLVKNNDE